MGCARICLETRRFLYPSWDRECSTPRLVLQPGLRSSEQLQGKWQQYCPAGKDKVFGEYAVYLLKVLRMCRINVRGFNRQEIRVQK